MGSCVARVVACFSLLATACTAESADPTIVPEPSSAGSQGLGRVTCSVQHWRTPLEPMVERFITLSRDAPSSEIPFASLALKAELVDDGSAPPVLLLSVASLAQHEFRFDRRVSAKTGMLTTVDPASDAEIHVACERSGESPVAEPRALAGAVECVARERASAGGTLADEAVLRLSPLRQLEEVSHSFKGATFGIVFDPGSEDGIGSVGSFSLHVSPDRGKKRTSQQFQAAARGHRSTLDALSNRLVDSLTGTSRVVTPLGTEIEYECRSVAGGPG